MTRAEYRCMLRSLRAGRRPGGRVGIGVPSGRRLDGPRAHVPLKTKARCNTRRSRSFTSIGARRLPTKRHCGWRCVAIESICIDRRRASERSLWLGRIQSESAGERWTSTWYGSDDPLRPFCRLPVRVSATAASFRRRSEPVGLAVSPRRGTFRDARSTARREAGAPWAFRARPLAGSVARREHLPLHESHDARPSRRR